LGGREGIITQAYQGNKEVQVHQQEFKLNHKLFIDGLYGLHELVDFLEITPFNMTRKNWQQVQVSNKRLSLIFYKPCVFP